MSLDISFKQDSNSDSQILSLQDGEDLQIHSGGRIHIKNPENVAQLVPKDNDLQVVCQDGSTYNIKGFLDVDFPQEPTLELKDGTSITRHNFVQQLDGIDMANLPDDQISQSLLLAPLHVIAVTSVSQKWDLSQYAPESKSLFEDSDITSRANSNDQQNQSSIPSKDDSLSSSTTRFIGDESESDSLIDTSSIETDGDQPDSKTGGTNTYASSSDAGFIDIDITAFIPQFEEDVFLGNITITVKEETGESTEIPVDPSTGTLRLPDTIFDEGPQKKFTISIQENGNQSETAITVTQTKDGGGETYHLILSHDRLAENVEGALIGKLDTDDGGQGHHYEYSILQDDSGIFEIYRNVLKLKDDISIDYEAQPDRYPITIVSTDENGNRIEQTVSIWPEDVNEPASLSSIGISSGEDDTVSFTPESFEESFEDEDSDYLEIIRIDSLPDNGVLFLNEERVTNGQLIDIDQVEDLEFHPDANHNGETNFTWSGFDGQTWSTESSSVNITISSVNDAPVVTVSMGDESTVTDTDFLLDLPENAFYDADIGDTLTYSGQIPSWLTIDPVTGSLSGTPGTSEIGDHEITITATDGSGESVSQSFQLTVDQANRAPTISQIDNQTADEDALFSLDASSGFADQDVDDILTYSATLENGDPLPDWVSIDAESGQISGTPSNEDVGSINLKVTASDGSESVSNSFSIEVLNTNDGPVVETSILDTATDEDSIFTLETSGNFSDQDLGDVLSFSATLENGDPIPDWLSIDPISGKLTGTPENEDVGTTTISVTASDGEASATDSFSLTVENTNDGPVVIADIPDQATEEDALFTLDSSANFDDADLGDELFYSATLENGDPLPDWISIDSETGQISGIPRNENIGDLEISITASDGEANASQSFTLTVENTNDAPTLTAQIDDVDATEDLSFSLDTSSYFADEDIGDELSYSAALENGDPLPGWLTIDSETGELSGAPANEDVGDISVTVVASDGIASASDSFTISVENTNDGPIVSSAIENQTVAEDAAFSLNVSNNFADEDLGDTLSYSATLENGDPLPNWITFDSESGQISGTPGNDDIGDIQITVTAFDGDAEINQSFTLSVENTNDAPILTSNIADTSAAEDAPFNLDVSSHFTDIDSNDELVFEAMLENGDPLPDWLGFDENTGLLSGQPTNEDVGDLAISIVASDGEELVSDTFTLTVANTNDGPVVTTSIDDQTTIEESAFNLDVSANFTDEDLGDTLSYSATLENGESLPSWLTIDPETGQIFGTPQNGDAGDLSITVTANDGETSASDTFSLTVENTGDGATVTTSIDDHTTDEDAAFSLDISGNFASDIAGNTLSYSAALENGESLPSWLSLDSETGLITGTPQNDDVGDFSITVTASDGQESSSDTFSLSVENTNDGPIVKTSIDNQVTDEDAIFSLDISSNFDDQDLGDELSYSATLENGDPLPDWLSVDPETGEISGTPENDDVGNIGITVTATDGEASASDTFSLTVENTNDGPAITKSIDNKNTDEDVEFNLDLSENFSDEDFGDTLSYSAAMENGEPLPDWISFDSETGSISGTPRNADVGDFQIAVTASDGQADISQTFTLTVENANDGPTLTANIANSNTLEDDLFTLDTSANFSDQDLGDTLSFSATLESGDPLPDWLSINGSTGQLYGTPENGDVGNISVTVSASDGQATVSDTFSLTVFNTNDAPLVQWLNDNQAVEEDALFSMDASSIFVDVDHGDSLSYSATLENGDLLPDWISIDSETGELSGTPKNSDVGELSLTLTAFDGEASTSKTFSLFIENTNDGPIVTSSIADQSVDEDTSFSLDVSVNFADEDLGDPLTYTAVLENGDPLPDWMSIDSETGEISGTPRDADVGAFAVTVTASDGKASASDTFSLTVENTNDGPTVSSSIVDQSIVEDEVFSLDVSGNFEDQDLGDTLSYSATLENGDPLPDWISIDLNTGEITGIPGDVNDISVTVTVSDGEASVSDTFSISVENTNDGPIVTSNILDHSTDEDVSFSLDLSSHFADQDLDDTLSFSATLENGDPLPDWLSIDTGTGQLSGIPQNEDVGGIGLIVTASDGETTASDSFTLNVENTNDGPTVSVSIADTAASEDATFALNVSGNFEDQDLGDTLSYSATLEHGDPLPSWLSIDSTTGHLSGTPGNEDVGDISVSVTASDGEASVSDTFTLTVENTNDGPMASVSIADTVANEDSAFSLNVSGNFEDQDLGDTLAFTATLENGDPLPEWLSIDPNTGVLSGVPENDDVGNIAVTVIASDGEASASDTFTLSVENTNDGPSVSTNIADAAADEDAAFTLNVSSNFEDQDLGDTLTFAATLDDGDPLPDWLSIDPVTGQLSGTPGNADVGDVSITVTASDGEASVSDTFPLTVENTNDGPTVSTSIDNQTKNEDDAFSLDVSSNFEDQDLGDTLTFTATLENGDPLPEWISFDSDTGVLSGVPENDDVGDMAITVAASDGEATASDTFTLSVENTNDGPTVSTNIADTTLGEDAAFSLNVSSNFDDQDLGDTLTFTATLENGDPLPDWLSIDAETGELSGTPHNAEVGNIQVTVTASDGDASVSDSFSLTIENTNDGPVVTNSINNQNTNEDEIFSLDVSSNFDDEDLGDSLSYSATLENGDPLPDWVSIDAETGTLSGSPDNDDVGNISITVIASDGEASVSDTFSLTVENTNDGPVVSSSIDNQSVEEDSTFSLDVASNFADQDLGDSLSYSATLENGDPLPDWISIDSETGQIFGTPHNTDVGSISITVNASDGEASVSDTFSLAIENTNDGPTVLTSINNQTTNEDDAFSLDASGNFEDEDLGDTLSYSATLENGDPLPSWLSIDTNTGELSGLPENDDVGTYSITVTASDGVASASDTFSVNVENTNDGPVASAFIGNQAIDEDNAFNLDLSSNFTDADVGDTLSFSASLVNGAPLPDWMSFDSQTGSLSGTPRNGDVGDIQIEIIASDGQAETSQAFTLTIENTNDGPMLTTNISNVNTLEDDLFSLDVSSNFLDQDLGDTLSYSATLENGDPLPDWLFFNTETGELSGTPLNEDVGDIAVTISASDGESSISDTFNLTIFNTNDAPLVQWLNDNQGVEEDALFNMDASTIFVDVDEGDSLTYAATLENGDPLPTWISINSVSGELSGTPTNDDVGEISLTLSAFDGEAYTSKTFSLYIENTNDGPVVSTSIVDQSVDEDAVFTLDVSTNFADDDLGEPLSFSATLENGDPLPSWMSIDSETGEISGTPRSGDVGEISVTVTASDGEALASDTFSLTIENTNDGPVVSTSIADQSTSEDTAFALDISGNFVDEDLGDTLSYSATLENGGPLPSWLILDTETGLISGTPENSDVGNVSVVITASDGEASASDTFSLTVENTNDGPIVSTSIDDTTTLEDNAFTLGTSGNFSDEDLGDSLNYTATLENGDPLPAWMNFDTETGRVSGTPRNSDVGNLSITVTASDGEASVSDTFSLTVENTNDGLTVTSNIADQNTEEDDAFTLDVSGNFADGDLGDILTYSGTLENGDPLPAWLSIDAATGQLSGTPSNTDVGNVSITITATDGESSASDIFSLTVENTNDGPTVSTSIDDKATSEDSLFNLDVSGNFADEDLGDTLAFSATLQNGDPLPSWLSIDAETGELSGTPRNDEVGILSVTVTASDGEASVSDTFDLTVENTNDGPTVSASISDAATSEDSAFSLNVTGNFADEDLGDTLSFSATLQNGDPLPTWLSIDATTGVLSGTPQNGDVGTIAVTVTASDGEADVSNTFDLNVENTNDGPIVSTSIDDVSTGEDAVFTLDVSSNFDDQDLGDTLTYSATLQNGDPLPEWISIDPETGELSGTPRNDEVGIVAVTVTASDGETSVSDTFDLSVENTNDGPTVSTSIGNQTTGEDAAFSLDASASFDDEDLGDTLTYSATLENGDPLPEWISIDPATGELFGTPENGDIGSISVAVTASDGTASVADTFSITVENTNDGPTVITSIADQSTDEDSTFSLDVSGNFNDEDLGDSLTFTALLTNESGTQIGDGSLPIWLTFDEITGQFSGTPENGDVGSFCVQVTASDGEASASDIVAITVENTNDGPVVTADIADQAIFEEVAFNLDVSGNFADADLGDTLTYSATLENGDPLPNWITIDSATGEVSGIPDESDVGNISVTVTASDGKASASNNFSINIRNTNKGPIANVESAALIESTILEIDVLSNDTDADGDALTITSASVPAGDGTVSIVNNKLVYDPGSDFADLAMDDTETIEITYTISDGHGGESTSTVDVTVTGDDSLIVDNNYSHTVLGTANANTILGGDGHDTILGGDGDDIIVGGAGNDDLYGEGGDDTFQVSEGDGYDDFYGGDGTDTVKSMDGSDIRIDGHFSASNSIEHVDAGGHADVKIQGDASSQTLDFSATSLDGIDTIDGGDGHDTIKGSQGSDTIIGGTGNDDLYGEGGDDTFLVSEGDGYDDFFGGEGTDTVRSTDGTDIRIDGHFSASNSIEHVDAGGHADVKIQGDASSQTLDFSATSLDGIDTIDGGDGHDTIKGSQGSDTIIGGTGNDDLYGEGGDDTFLVSEGDGYDDFFGGEGTDTVRSTDGTDIRIDGHFSASNSIEHVDAGGHADVKIQGDASSQTLDFSATSLDGIDTIDGGDGHDTIKGSQGSDTIIGGTGNDDLYGEGGDDTFLVSEGDGYDDFFGGEGTDTVRSTDGTDIRIDGHFSASNSIEHVDAGGHADVKIQGDASSQTLDFSATSLDGIDTIDGGDGHDTIKGSQGSDTIIGGTGNDDLYGEGGDDTFLVSEGDGYDDFFGGEGTDTVRSTDGTDIRIDGHFSASNSIEHVDAGGHADVKIQGDASSQTLDFSATSLDGIDTIDGGDGHDTIKGSQGSDTIIGGTGNDDLYGEGGDDTFLVSEGDGYDDFFGGEGTDTVRSTDGTDIRIDGHFSASNSVESIDAGGHSGVKVTGDASSQTLDFSATSLDGIESIEGGGGHDTITGTAGDDVIVGGTGYDDLYGGAGDDTFLVSEGDEYDDFFGGEGTDTVKASGDNVNIGIDGHFSPSNSIENISADGHANVTLSGDGSSQTLDFSGTTLDSIQSIDAGAGHDIVTGSSADDTVEGGTGTDTYVLLGNRSDYFVTDNEDGSFRVEDLVDGRGGVDTVSDFENFQFADGTLNSTDVLDNPPIVSSEIANQNTDEDSLFSLDTSANFQESDGDTLAYSATLENGDPLPSWLSIDSNTGELSGTPENGDVGGISVTVTASDGNALASDTFSITVENTNDGPTANDDNLSSFSPESATLSTEINFNDGVPSANYGTITQESNGMVGNAADFSSAKLSVDGIDLASDAGAKTTVSMWIQGDPSGSWEMLVGSARHDLVLLNGNIGFNTSQGDLFGSDASELSDGNWHHVVATFTNGDVTQNSIYIDGVDQSLSQIQGTPSSGYANIDSDNGTLHFGSWGYDDSYRFTGSMDEIKVYDGTLSSQEVGELYDIENSHNHWENAGASATEDTELVISPSDLLSNDIDVDGDTLSITSVQDATHGTVEINVDGDIVFTPDANYNGEASFSYTVSDGNGGTNTASVTLDVDAINDNVSVVTDTNASANSIAENAANGTEVGITAAAEDVDGDPVSYSIVDEFGNTVTDGPFEINADTGIITVRDTSQIDYETSTAHNIVVKATSSDGSTSTETYTVAVTDTNDGPTVTTAISDQTTNEDAAFSLDVSSNFSDEDLGDTLTYSVLLTNESGNVIGDGSLPDWLSFNGSTAQFSGTPGNGDVDSFCVQVTASDGTSTVSDIVALTVANTNDGPTLTTLVDKTLWQEDFASLTNGATSDNGDTAWSTDETAATLSPTHGVSNEAYEFSQTTTTAGDDGALLKLQTEAIDISGKSDLELTFDLMTEGGMEESGDFFDFFQVIAIVDNVEHEIHQQDGNHTSGDNVFHTISLTGLPEGDSLALSFEAKTTATSEIFTLDNIRLDGDALGIANQTVNEEAAFSLDVSSSFADEDVGDTLTYSASLENGDPLPTWLSIDTNTGVLSGTPANGEDGTINVTVTASDGTASVSDTFDVTVNDIVTNLIGQWKLDETSGTSAEDSAGSNDGVYTNGVTLGVDGVLDTGNAASFDGVNDYVEIAPSTDFQVDDGTLVMSFRTDAISGTQTLFSRDSSGYDGGGHLTAYVESDGTLTVRFQSESTSYLVSSASGAVDAGTNHQMAFSFGTNGMELSLDGAVVDTDTYTGGIGGNNEPIVIGVNQWGSGDGVADVLVDYFNGTIDNVEIYDGQLSESAIDTLYAQVDDNSAPITNTLISDQSVDEDAAFSLDVSSNFSDADVGDTLTFSATLENGDPLPTWLTFDANTQQFSGTPADGDDGTISVKVTASDGEASTFDTFDIDVLAPPELIGQWKLDESSGTSAADSAGTNDGVYTNGVTLGVNGVLDTGSAASFDGSNDYVEVAPSTDFQIDNGTFVMAFNTDSLSGQQTLFSRDSSGYDGGGHLDAYVESDGTLTVRFQSATSSYYVSSDAGAVDAGTNHQIAFSFGSKGMELSLDGAVVDTDAYTGGIGGNNEPITIGASQSSSGNDTANNMHDYFNGTIDNLEVYDGQLSESAIDTLYAQVDDNSAPITNTLISDQSVDEDAAFSLDVSSNFTDANVGDTLTFSATLQNGDPLPTWLTFNTTTGQFSGTPADGDDGTISVKVTASDGEASTFDTFDIDVLPPPELVGQWKLDESSGTAAADSVGINDGVYTHGVTLGSNGVLDTGTAATFDGVNDYVEIAPSTDFQLANGTFVVSFNADNLSSDRTLFSRDSSNYDGGGHLDAYVETDGTVVVRFQSDSHSYYIESAAGAVSVGENHQMAFSFGSKGVQLFLDGTLVDTDTYTGDIQGNNEPITIGASQVVSGNDIANNLQEFFSGTIDNLEIYDGQLAQSDVTALYANLSDPDQSVSGTTGADTITTGSGDDTIDTEGGADTVDSGLGDDTIIIEDTSFNQLDFGTGEDTLEISGAGIDLDFSLLDASKLTNVETIDLNGTGANSIHLSASDVLDMTDGDKTLFIEGGSDDTVDISTDFSNQGTHTVDGVDYSHYYDAGTDSHLYINSDITDLNTF